MQLLMRIPTGAAHPAAVAARGVALRVPASAVSAGRGRVERFGRWSAPLVQRGFAADTAQPINGAKSAPRAYQGAATTSPTAGLCRVPLCHASASSVL